MRYALLFAALCGCAAQPEFTTPEWKIDVYSEYSGHFLTPEVVDTSTSYVVSGLAELGYPGAPAAKNVQVVTYAHEWACPTATNPDQKCAGQQLVGVLSLAVATTKHGPICIWQTALMHEMAHRILEVAIHDPDAGHTLKDVWAIADATIGDCS